MGYRVGERVSFEGHLCTIRYVGEVRNTGKEWIGVEWDNPSRGKHDGQGYFKCHSDSPTAASFLRLSRNPGPTQCFVQAVEHKYQSNGTELSPLPIDKQIVISGKVAEEIGFDKIRAQQAQIHELKVVLVDGQRINRVDGNVKEKCPKIVELDLSRNLFEDLKPISLICGQLEKLRSLRLNGNRLTIDPVDLEASQQAFENIKSLELDDMAITWGDLCMLVEKFMFATSLTASSNCFSKLTLPIKHSHLTSLTLEYNKFRSLVDLHPLSQLTTLESLLLKGNEIFEIGTMADLHKMPVFHSNLRYIDLSYNEIKNWDFIDSLDDVFPGMESLRVSHNPLYQATSAGKSLGSIEEGFMLTLARLRNLKTLNFSNVTPTERTNAELFYYSQIGKEMAQVPPSEEYRVIARHKRYKELFDKNDGPPTVVREDERVDPNFLEARLINFKFFTPANPQLDVEEVVHEKEIPKGFDVYRVKGIVGRLFGVKPLKLRLIWETGDIDPVAGYEDIEDISDGSDDEDQAHDRVDVQKKLEGRGGEWIKREVELEDGTRQVGFLVDGQKVNIRVEFR